MKVYLKIHLKDEIETIACCDEKLLNQVFKEGNLRIEISNRPGRYRRDYMRHGTARSR